MGPLYCLFSAVGFGLMAIFAKLAYADGVTVDGLLVARFGLAGLVLLVISVATGSLRRLGRRGALAGLAMGAVGYASQSGLYLAAVSRVEASQVALVFCVYPVLVMVGAILVGREGTSGRRMFALVMALAGIALVLGGAATGSFDLVASALSLGSALVYCCYILVGDCVVGEAPVLALTAMVCVGAFATWLSVNLLRGGPSLDFGLGAWGWLAAVALISTVGAILLFFGGLARVGPTIASLLSIIEPVVTVVGAALVFHEALTVVQALGGLLVLASVAVVQWPARRPVAEEALLTVPPVAGAFEPVAP